MRAIAGVLLLGGLLVGLPLVQVQARDAFLSPSASSSPPALSSYWDARIQRWESLILQEAERRGLDPDFVASLIWRESRGDPKAIGPSGSVGLMQIMPKEAGFTWRPTRDELIVPFTNVYWGSRTLSTIIRQGRGDVFSALAAYNGGWAKVESRGPRSFATTILRDYARAVAHRQNLEGHWVAFFAIVDEGMRGPIWVADSGREDVYFYGDANVTPEGGRLIPPIAPVSWVAKCEDEAAGATFSVGIWIYRVEEQQWLAGSAAVPLGLSNVQSGLGQASESAVAVSPALMAGSARPTAAAGTMLDAVPVARAQDAPDQASAVAALPESTCGEVTLVAIGLPGSALAGSALTGSVPVDTASVVAVCAGEPLAVEVVPLEPVGTPEGWTVRVRVQATGGTCLYTYAWMDESVILGTDLREPIEFELRSVRRDAALLGTVVVTSGAETVPVELSVRPPD